MAVQDSVFRHRNRLAGVVPHASGGLAPCCYRLGLVVAPCAAEPTRVAYLASAPEV